MLRGRGHRMAQRPRNGLVDQAIPLEIFMDFPGVMEFDASLENLAHLAKLVLVHIPHAVRKPIRHPQSDMFRQHSIELVQLGFIFNVRLVYVHLPENEHVPHE